MARAASSFPVPVSPVIKAGALQPDIFLMSAKAVRKAGELPTRFTRTNSLLRLARSISEGTVVPGCSTIRGYAHLHRRRNAWIFIASSRRICSKKFLLRGTKKQRATCIESLQTAEASRYERARLQESVYSTGNKLLAGFTRGHLDLRRRTYDARDSISLPGVLERSEGDPPVEDDVAVNEGMEIVQIVHYRRTHNNTFWNGHQMIYGDGDGDIFERFTIDLDIIALLSRTPSAHQPRKISPTTIGRRLASTTICGSGARSTATPA